MCNDNHITVAADNDNNVAFTRKVAHSAKVHKHSDGVQDDLNVVRDVKVEASCNGSVASQGCCGATMRIVQASPRTGPRREPVKTVGSLQPQES